MKVAALAALLIVAFAAAESANTLRLTDASHGIVHAASGQVIQVAFNFTGADVLSSDEAVVKPLGTASGPPRTHYFIAGVPGRSVLNIAQLTCKQVCALARIYWRVEVDVA
jgi:hypothetical protein